MDHFGPGAELLDINSEGDVIKFLGYTEKAVDVNTACMSSFLFDLRSHSGQI